MTRDEKTKRSEDADAQQRGRWVLRVMAYVCLGYAVFIAVVLVVQFLKMS